MSDQPNVCPWCGAKHAALSECKETVFECGSTRDWQSRGCLTRERDEAVAKLAEIDKGCNAAVTGDVCRNCSGLGSHGEQTACVICHGTGIMGHWKILHPEKKASDNERESSRSGEHESVSRPD